MNAQGILVLARGEPKVSAVIRRCFCGFYCFLMIAGILVLWLAPPGAAIGAVSSTDIGLMTFGFGFFFNFLLLLTHLSTLPDSFGDKKPFLLPGTHRKKRY